MLNQKQVNQCLATLVSSLFVLPFMSAQEITWTEMTPMPTARVGVASAVLDGKIFVIGGLIDRSSEALQVVEVYDPEMDAWETKNPFPVPVTGPPGAEVVNGKLYVIGGRAGFNQNITEYDKVWTYDPGTDSWEEVGEIPDSPNGIPGTCVLGDEIYSIGGAVNLDAHGRNLSFNPDSNNWHENAPIDPPRFNSSIVSRGNMIYVMGGTNIANTLQDLQEYNPENSTWKELPSMPERRFYGDAVVINDKIYAMQGVLSPATGGLDGRTFVYDLNSETWSIQENDISEITVGYALNVVGDSNSTGSVYLIGGATSDWWDESGGPIVSNRVWKYALEVTNVNARIAHQLRLDVHPNPASDIAHVRYEIPIKSNIQLHVYDLNGRTIEVLVKDEQPPGAYSIDFNTNGIPAGIYICSIELDGNMINKKIVIGR